MSTTLTHPLYQPPTQQPRTPRKQLSGSKSTLKTTYVGGRRKLKISCRAHTRPRLHRLLRKLRGLYPDLITPNEKPGEKNLSNLKSKSRKTHVGGNHNLESNRCGEKHDKYSYTPLDEEAGEIRLVIILPGEFSDPVEVLLETFPFTDAEGYILNYQALSYTWGDTTNQVPIRVKDGADIKHILVTRNLAEALPYLRNRKRKQTYWIDAICINQEDLIERSLQVKRMAELYSSARMVNVWLGPEENDSDLVMRGAKHISSNIKVNWTLLTMQKRGRIYNSWVDHDARRLLPALEYLLERPWFKRLWIWQEILLAEHAVLICGFEKIKWLAFRDFIFWLHRFAEQTKLQGQVERIYSICGMDHPYRRDNSLMDIFQATQHSQCFDDRDRLFAIFSLLGGYYYELIKFEPDYTKTTSEVYKQFAIAHYTEMGNLSIMRHCRSGQSEKLKSEGSLPSWAPDWSTPIGNEFTGYGMTASGASRAIATLSTENDKVLHVTGISCAAIDKVRIGSEFQDLEIHRNKVRELIEFFAPTRNDITKSQYAPMANKSTLEALTRTVCQDLFADTTYPSVDRVLPPFYACEHVMSHWCNDALPDANCDCREYYEDCDTNMRRAIQGFALSGAFFTTSEGYMGVGPHNTMPGDVVSVFLGLDNPIVLRPVGNDHYQLIGTCFVYGLMSSEAILGALPGAFRQIFRLSEKVDGHCFIYFDHDAGEVQKDDPRQGSLPKGWHIDVRDPNHKLKPLIFVNEETGKGEEYDPRLEPAVLKERNPDLDLRVFDLV